MNATIPSATAPVASIDSSRNPAPATASSRLQSLDAYRGLIMLTLLTGALFSSLKGHPGLNWLGVQCDHVAWAGCVYWDLIQPAFMFMVGVALPFAMARRAALGDSWSQRLRHVLIRALNLIVLGIILDHFGSEKIQVGFIRVLQQIAFGYVVAFFLVGKSFRTQGLAAAAILIGYNLVWMYNPWNGPEGPWAKSNTNMGSAFDQWMLGRNYSGYYVGLNAIPSTATILFGVMAGQLILNQRPPRKTMLLLLGFGLGGLALGWIASPWLPLIKRIWTPSFAVYAGGWTVLILLFFYWTIEVMGWKRWAFPLVVVGTNSIAAYVLANICGGWFKSLSGAWIGWLKAPLGEMWFPVLQKSFFMVAAGFVLYWLYRRKIFFKL